MNRTMRTGGLSLVICALALASPALGATFTNFDVGPASTTPLDINDAGVIVGFYQDPSGVRGFKLDHGAVTFLSDPAATQGTYAQGINAAGTIVGHYSTGPSGGPEVAHAFVLNGTTYQNLDAPGAVGATLFLDISNSGLIVGSADDAAGVMSGLIYNGTSFTRVAAPGSNYTLFTGVNDAGVITGYDVVGGDLQPFWYDGAFHSLPVLGLTPLGINNAGLIVGIDPNGAGRGFVYDILTSQLTTFVDPAGTNGTFAEGVNILGDIVGTYNDRIRDHGFVLSNGEFQLGVVPEPSAWALMILGFGALGGRLRARRSPGELATA